MNKEAQAATSVAHTKRFSGMSLDSSPANGLASTRDRHRNSVPAGDGGYESDADGCSILSDDVQSTNLDQSDRVEEKSPDE